MYSGNQQGMKEHKQYIAKTLELAKKGKGLVSPNPLAGALIVKNNRIISNGWHKAFGMPHAEIDALKKAGDKGKGATLYINLEPCCHYGKTAPCTKAIIAAGIKQVVCPMEDPNPLVAGKGFKELEKNGITVKRGILKEDAEKLNRAYITYITQKRPYVILKWAQTLDGKIATGNGDSKWITDEKTRDFVKRLRFETDALLVGINTIIRDNPSLDYIIPSFQTVKRALERKRYKKIILDPHLKMPRQSRLWEDQKSDILLVVSDKTSSQKIEGYRGRERCDILLIPEKNGEFHLRTLMDELYRKEIGIIMVEGGNYTLTSFWEEKLADEIMVFTGNKVLGGHNSLSPISGQEREHFSEAVKIKYSETKMIGNDLFVRGEPCFQG